MIIGADRITTYDIGLDVWHPTSASVQGDMLILKGKVSADSPVRLHIHNVKSRTKDGSVKLPCKHGDYVKIQTLDIERRSFVAVNCWRCARISLYDLSNSSNEDYIVAYQSNPHPASPISKTFRNSVAPTD